MRKRNTKSCGILLLLLLMTGTGVLAQDSRYVPPGAGDRCPVCGMFVAPYTAWIAAVHHDNDTWLYFDGPKDMFTYLEQRAEPHPALSAAFVTEYYTQRVLPAGMVFFISGSDVLGPMGKELVPVAGNQAAKTFIQDHGGSRVMTFDGHELQETKLP